MTGRAPVYRGAEANPGRRGAAGRDIYLLKLNYFLSWRKLGIILFRCVSIGMVNVQEFSYQSKRSFPLFSFFLHEMSSIRSRKPNFQKQTDLVIRSQVTLAMCIANVVKKNGHVKCTWIITSLFVLLIIFFKSYLCGL